MKRVHLLMFICVKINKNEMIYNSHNCTWTCPVQNCYVATYLVSMPLVIVPSTASNPNENVHVLSEHDKC